MSRFYVSRQHQWPDGIYLVEIAHGGLDAAGPDMLVKKYPGEAEGYDTMTEAVEAGIQIAESWKQDKPNLDIHIGAGDTMLAMVPVDAEETNEETYAKLRSEATQYDDSLPKCERCGDPLPYDEKKRWSNETSRMMNSRDDAACYCSENCANLAEEEFEREAEEFARENAVGEDDDDVS